MSQLLTDEDLDGILREKFAGAGGALRLAQVLVEIFGTIRPDGVTVTGPVTIRQPSDGTQPALIVVPAVDPLVPPTNVQGGGTDPATIVFPTPPAPGSVAPALPVVLYGIVQSGSGVNYVVRLWMTDPSGSPLGDYNCTQSQIDPAETIPAGTVCLVWVAIAAGNLASGFRMTVPVFVPFP